VTYWALRSYLPADHPGKAQELGCESTPAEYIAQQMLVFDELHRVLRDDGSLVVNLGDTYSSSPAGCKGVSQSSGLHGIESDEYRERLEGGHSDKVDTTGAIPPKSLCGIPERFMLAMIDRDWILRNKVVWKKKSAMPTSARDRMRCSWEPCFVFVKRGRYFSDVDAVRTQMSEASIGRYEYSFGGAKNETLAAGDQPTACVGDRTPRAGANPGDVLTLGPQPSKIEHYAMYPVRLPLWFMRWLMPRKCCSECGMAWGRVVESKGGTTGKSWHDHSDDAAAGMHQTQDSIGNAANENGEKYSRTTLRWQPQCECKWFRLKRDVPEPVLDKIRSLM